MCVRNQELASAQATGSLSGIVAGPSGARISKAKVTVSHAATGFRRETLTNAEGAYVLTQLPPGTYRLEISRQGFRTVAREQVVIPGSLPTSVDVHLEVESKSCECSYLRILKLREPKVEISQLKGQQAGMLNVKVTAQYDYLIQCQKKIEGAKCASEIEQSATGELSHEGGSFQIGRRGGGTPPQQEVLPIKLDTQRCDAPCDPSHGKTSVGRVVYDSGAIRIPLPVKGPVRFKLTPKCPGEERSFAVFIDSAMRPKRFNPDKSDEDGDGSIDWKDKDPWNKVIK